MVCSSRLCKHGVIQLKYVLEREEAQERSGEEADRGRVILERYTIWAEAKMELGQDVGVLLFFFKQVGTLVSSTLNSFI